MIGVLILFVLPFLLLVFIALSYDRTVTPLINWFKNTIEKAKISSPSYVNYQSQITHVFRLYDGAIAFFIVALILFSYNLYKTGAPFYISYPSYLFLAWLWILFLFKIHRVEVLDNRIFRFRCFFRKIDLNPDDITRIEDWLRFVRIRHKGGSLIIFPFIEKLGEFKSLAKSMNPKVEIKDVSNWYFSSNIRVFLLVVGIFGWFIFLIFHYFHKWAQLK